MSNLVALTNVKHGEDDGTVTEVAYGESIDDLPQEVIDNLTALGLVGTSDGIVAAAAEAVKEEEVEEVEEVKEEEPGE